MNVDKKTEYLKRIDETIEQGHYSDDWESLCNVSIPSWYEDAKFGIFIHWGVYSVPAFGNEWYPRNMYIEGSPAYDHHVKTYGSPKDFPYSNFIPMFKAEKFDPAAWADLFKKSGARYIMPVAEHHDGVQMYDSDLSDWNVVQMGPKRDVLGELKQAIESRDMVFSASSHRAENYWFFGGCRTFDSGIQDMEFQEPYGWAHPMYSDNSPKTHEGTHYIYSTPASEEHMEDWLVRSCELVDKYQPKIVWFDWWIHNVCFKPYLKKFAAYYYNRALEWAEEVAINYKYDAFMNGSGVFDIERGQLKGIRPELWQNDTAIAKNSWGYTENNDFKTAEDLVADLMDIVSKNGCLLLNVGPKADGTIGPEDREVLENIGSWLETNGEAVYGTRAWSVFGEGPTEIPEGSYCDVNRAPFTSQDVRYTFKPPYVYATVLGAPAEEWNLCFTSLAKKSSCFQGHVESVELLGFDNELSWDRSDDDLKVSVNGSLDTTYPVCFKVKLD